MTFFVGTCLSGQARQDAHVDLLARSEDSSTWIVLEPLMYRAVTRNIEVQVRPFYLEDRSDPSENRYVWAIR